MPRAKKKHINDRRPNFYGTNEDGTPKFYLVRCFACDTSGRENYLPAVALGVCCWCGWKEEN